MIQLSSEFYSSKGEQFKVEVFAENWEGFDLPIIGGSGNTFYVDKDWTCYLRQYQSVVQLKPDGVTWDPSQIWSLTYNEAEDRTEITTLRYYTTNYSRIKNDLLEQQGAYGSHTHCELNIENIETEWNSQGDEILEAIKHSSTTCTYSNQTGGLDRFHEMYVKATDNDLKMLIYRDNSGWELEWAGNIVLDLIEQSNTSKPRPFTIKAIDGLRKLKDLPYEEVTSARTPSYYTLIERIQEILAGNDLAQFWDASDPYIRESIEFQSDEVVSASALTSPLAYTRAADGLFIKYNDKDEGEVFTYYEALKGILDVFSCRIVHSQGMYHILQVRNYDTSGYSYREFVKSGTTYTLGTHNHRKDTNPIGTATRSTDAVVLSGGKFGNLPGLYKSSMMVQTHTNNRISNGINSFVQPSDSGSYPTLTTVQLGTVRGGTGSGATMRLNIPVQERVITQGKQGTYKLRIEVEFQCGSGATAYGITGSAYPTWVTGTGAGSNVWFKEVWSVGDGVHTDVVFETPEIPFTEEDVNVQVTFILLDAFGSAVVSTTNYFGNWYAEYAAVLFPIDGSTEPNKELYVENHLTDYTKELKLDDLIISDLSNTTSIKTLEVQTDHVTTATNWDEAVDWDADYSSSGTLAYFRVKEAMSLQYQPPMVYRGKIEGVYYATQSMYYTDFAGDRVTFVLNGMKYNYAMDEYDGEWFEFLGDRTSTGDVDVITDIETLPGGRINGEAKGYESNLIDSTETITRVSTATPAGTITSIPIVNLTVALIKAGDLITVLDPVTNEPLHSFFSIATTPTTSTTSLAVETAITTEDIPAGAKIIFHSWQKQTILGGGATIIHTDVAGEIEDISNKATPVGADKLLIEDSSDSWNKKEINISDLPSSGLSDVVDDTTPQLGGDLDSNGNDIGINGTDSYLKLAGQSSAPKTGVSASAIYMSGSSGSNYPFQVIGNLVIQSRTNGWADIVFIAGNTQAVRGFISSGGVWGVGYTDTADLIGGYKLEVNGDAYIDGTLSVNDGFESPLTVTDATNPTLLISLSDTSVIDNQNIGRIAWKVNDANTGGVTETGEISMSFNDNTASGPSQGSVGEGADMIFTTGKVASAGAGMVLTEQMRIDKDGVIIVANMPTSSTGLPTGALWSDSGTIKIV